MPLLTNFAERTHLHGLSFKRFSLLMRTVKSPKFDGSEDVSVPLGVVLLVLFHSHRFLSTSHMLPVLMGLAHCAARFFELALDLEQLKPLGTKGNLLEGCRIIFDSKMQWVLTPELDQFVQGWTAERVRYFLVDHPEEMWKVPVNSIPGETPVDCAKSILENVGL
jgi:hypothetical protein